MELNKNTMKVKLPPFAGQGQETFVSGKNSIVLIGANGSGKTRMSVWIEFNNQNNCKIHRIPAQKSLNMPVRTNTSEMKSSQNNFWFGTENLSGEDNWLKMNHRYHNKPSVSLIDDFSKLMVVLFTDAFQKMWEEHEKNFTEITKVSKNIKLDRVKDIWENVINNKILKISAGKVEAFNKDSANMVFNGSEMSDGEREIFYFIGTTLCVPSDSLVIVDEPENHLHKSILIRLWNAIEAERPDCTFLYVTHSLDFAVSRNNSQIIWVKNMPKRDVWEYELLSEDDPRIDAVKMEILGNRQNVLLVEGTQQKSIDRRLYSAIFKDYNVIPVESCDRVIAYTRACQNLSEFHYCEVKGIVDRDRRSETDIEKLNRDNIFCPEVSEIENLFLLPEVIKVVAEKQDKLKFYDEILKSVQERTFDFLSKKIDSQTLLFVQQNVQNQINCLVGKKENDLETYEKNVAEIQNIDIKGLHAKIKSDLQKIIDDRNFCETLKIINDKGLLPSTNLSNTFGWKKDYYIDYVIGLLNGTDVSEKLCDIFSKYVNIDKNLEVSNNVTQ